VCIYVFSESSSSFWLESSATLQAGENTFNIPGLYFQEPWMIVSFMATNVVMEMRNFLNILYITVPY